ncbi:hypothetical protein FNAPI_2235 [Fusarium napiforme]|uniref:Fungal N-terminal domain-containing protein n=1 Tax=Fusarium napiforme TaxID=42672 RepID=A0A8H5K0S4_9HYPO|nr:hypothetical protein FNAPI_2235 [Fusarium napiforme]
MELISLTFEITSLSMQLVAMVKAIKGLVTAYKSAAQELEELCVKLDNIETICDSLGAALSHVSSSTPIPGLSSLLSKLNLSIHDCYDKVSTVNKVIEEISANLEPSRNPFKNIGGLFLRYRPQLATYIGSLERSHSTLRDMIAAMTLCLVAKSSQATSISIPVVQPLAQTGHFPVMPEFYSTSRSVPSQDKPKEVTKRWRHQCSSLAFLQKTQKSRTQGLNASNSQSFAHTQESSTFTFGSSLLNTYIQLSIMRGSLAPLSVRLQIPRVLLISEDATGVGGSVQKAFDSDDLQAVQSLFSQGVLTPATVVTYAEYNPEDEASLLGVGLLPTSLIRCTDFVLARNVASITQDSQLLESSNGFKGAKDGRNHAASYSFPYRYPDSNEAFACFLEYIHIRKELITPAEFEILLGAHEVRRLTAYVEACRQYFPHDWDRFHDVVLGELSHGFGKLCARQMSDVQLEAWAPLFMGVLSRSQEVVTSSKYHPFTATIWVILWYSSDSDDAWYRVCRWIDMLELAHVDVANYLEVAIKYCSDNWVETKAWCFRGLELKDSAVRRPLRSRYHKGRMLPYWIEYADNSCPIRELLTEFPALRYKDSEIRWGSWSVDSNEKSTAGIKRLTAKEGGGKEFQEHG